MPARSRRRVLPAVLAAACVLALALGGCSDPAAPSSRAGSASDSSSASASAAVDAGVLARTWVVTDTGTAADGTTVVFDATAGTHGTAVITAACGTIRGRWAANDLGRFLGAVQSWSARCDAEQTGSTDAGLPAQLVAWYTTATTFEPVTSPSSPAGSGTGSAGAPSASASPDTMSGDDGSATIRLANSAGAQIATLVALQGSATGSGAPVSPVPDPSSSAPGFSVQPDARAGETAIVGKWVQRGRPQTAPTPPFLDFASDGTWTGSDGCNSSSGRWLMDGTGAVLATSGPSTLVGCAGMADLGAALTQAAHIGILDGTLLLLDQDGSTILSLVPEKPSSDEASASAGPVSGTASGSPASTAP